MHVSIVKLFSWYFTVTEKFNVALWFTCCLQTVLQSERLQCKIQLARNVDIPPRCSASVGHTLNNTAMHKHINKTILLTSLSWRRQTRSTRWLTSVVLYTFNTKMDVQCDKLATDDRRQFIQWASTSVDNTCDSRRAVAKFGTKLKRKVPLFLKISEFLYNAM